MGIAIRPDAQRKQQEETQQDVPAGSNAIAGHLSEVQNQALERFRALLTSFEEENLERQARLTKQSRYTFYISILMNASFFFVNVMVIVWGLLLLTYYDNLLQQVGGSMLAALATLSLAFSGRSWSNFVEHARKFYAQQTRVRAAFTAYMNRLSELRLMFETDYLVGKITLGDLERYQRMLYDLTAQSLYQIDPS